MEEQRKIEAEYEKQREITDKLEEDFKEKTRGLARMEIENDEMKNHVRQMGFMLEEMQEKLDS